MRWIENEWINEDEGKIEEKKEELRMDEIKFKIVEIGIEKKNENVEKKVDEEERGGGGEGKEKEDEKIGIVEKIEGEKIIKNVDEGGVDLKMKWFKKLDVIGILRMERIECKIVDERSIEKKIKKDIIKKLGKEERGRKEEDGEKDGGGVGDDLVERKRDNVEEGGRKILKEEEKIILMLKGKIEDEEIDKERLKRREERRIDGYGKRRGMIVGKGILKNKGSRWERKSGKKGCEEGNDWEMKEKEGDLSLKGEKKEGNKEFKKKGKGEIKNWKEKKGWRGLKKISEICGWNVGRKVEKKKK